MRHAAALVAVPLLSLAACASPDGATAPTAAVPDGVAEQYSALAAEIEERGGEVDSGPWTVGYIVEEAEPWFAGADRESFQEPTPDQTHHIEVIPREAETGRIVPDVPVRVEVVDAGGKVVDSRGLHFLHSTFFHYANNFSVPEEGTYSLHVSVGIPDFHRHGEAEDQPVLSRPTTVTFDDVELTTG